MAEDRNLAALASLLPIVTPKDGSRIDVDDLVSATACVSRANSLTCPSSKKVVLNLLRLVLGENTVNRIQRFLGVQAHTVPLADYQEISINGLVSFVDIQGKTILEVGSDEGGNVLVALEERGVKFALGIDVWKRKDWFRVLSKKLVHAYGDVLSLPYRDNSFDVLLNIATFEHIHNLDVTMHEMYRLLKPEGIMYAQFGPIWSSAVGHHIWCNLDDKIFRFDNPDLNPLDDFDHLLYDRSELTTKLMKFWDDRTANHLVKAVFDHSHINRMFHHEICDYMRQSPLEVLHLEKSWDIAVPLEIEQRLRDRHGDKSDFSCAGMQIVLQKGTTK
tara:strand:- start:12487 stop:13482 length:996 start_codon:yes stop_codon:yes gene_type:complete